MPPDTTPSAPADAGFHSAEHTIVLSDVHLCEAEIPDPKRPLWKKFKQRELFFDDCFARFLDYILKVTEGPVELVFNGDLFDFDGVCALPEAPEFPVSWLERRRGLHPEERKSLWKIRLILAEHPVWFDALRDFLLAGHRVVFVIGNHDLELHWPSVQAAILETLDLPDAVGHVRFCEWFYVSNADTLIQHGNQFDSYCLSPDPINPYVQLRGEPRVRQPFGNLAERYMLNGMGMFNPYSEDTFIRSGWEYIVFFYRHIARTQPLLLLTWFWSASVTLFMSLREGFLPAIKDALRLEERMEDVARRSNSTPRVARALLALSAHSAIYSPWKIARELWLDRALLLGLLVAGSFQVFSLGNLFVNLSPWWWALAFVVLLPPLIFYTRGVNSDINDIERVVHKLLLTVARAADVKRVILGHTHRERHIGIGGVELINTGTWSSAYKDVECTQPHGRRCFAWIKPDPAGAGRVSELREWQDPGSEVCLPDAPPKPFLPSIELPGLRTADAGRPAEPSK